MKKFFKLTALVLVISLISALIPIASVSAASYPLITPELDTSWTIPQGEVGYIRLSILVEYKNEKYNVEVYNSSGKKVAAASNTYYNASGSFIKYVNISVDTSALDGLRDIGTYTVKYWASFYSLGEWHDAPNAYTYTFKVIKNVCNGNHSLAVDHIVSEGSCSKEGTREMYCTRCEHRFYEDYKGDHTFGSWSMVDSSNHQHTCTGCGATESDSHNWDSGKITKQPTCAQTGIKTYTCTDCSGTKTESIAKTDNHSYGSWTKDDSNTHSHTCTLCGDSESSSHSWNNGTITKQPTCAETGVKTYTCSVCKGTKTSKIAKTDDHTYGDWVKADDSTHIRTCTLCSDTESSAHNWDEDTVTKQPSCAETGIRTYSCLDCGSVKTEEIAKTNDHNYGTGTKVDDETHHHSCMICGNEETVAHQWDSGKITVMPTLETTGLREYSCVDCDAIKTEVLPKRANGDINGDTSIDNKDVEYLLWHTLFPDSYPLELFADFDFSSIVDNKDVEYLLWHTLFPDSYPLYTK